jgi:rhodanese-related sulfurtransferase
MNRVLPYEAWELMECEGYLYIDVRAVEEFEQGHPEGAYNVPFVHYGPGGARPNPDFLRVVERHFPRDAKIILGCKTGGRSLRAGRILDEACFKHVVDQRFGYDGVPGRLGWRALGLPVARRAPAERSYAGLLETAD